MPEQRRIGYAWNPACLMTKRNLRKTTEMMPLLRSCGSNVSESQVYRLVMAMPECIPARPFAALCDILDCTPNDLFEPTATSKANAPASRTVVSRAVECPLPQGRQVARCRQGAQHGGCGCHLG